MNLSRANEKPIEQHGDSAESAGGVKDWQVDRLATALVRLEDLFNQAIAEQERHSPVGADVVLSVKSTMNDLRQVAMQDPQSLRTIAAHAEALVADSERGKVANYFGEGAEKNTAVATLALAANAEFAKSTFYGISKDACGADIRLERMCQRAHALVRAGYVGEKELVGIEVAITENSSSNAKAAETFHTLARQASPTALRAVVDEKASQVDQLSMFKDDLSKVLPLPANQPTITVNADQSRESLADRPEPTVDMFSHEIGHWLARDKAPAMLAAGVDMVKSSGGPDATLVVKFFPPADLEPQRLSMLAEQKGGVLQQEIRSMELLGRNIPVSWLATAKEMQGDLMAIAAENAEFGKSAALVQANVLLGMRDNERVGHLATLTAELRTGETKPDQIRFTEEHYTSAAIRDFTDKVREGALDKVHTPEQLDRLMGESVVRGLMEQYTQARSAELNVHHLENGRVVPGPPAGIDMKDILVAEMARKMQHSIGQPTVLLTDEQARRLPQEAQIAELNLSGWQADGQDVRYHLSTMAPKGIEMPAISPGTVKVGEFEVTQAMAPFARDVLERSDSYREAPAPGRAADVDARAPSDASIKVADLGSQEQQGKVQAAERQVEAAQPKMAEMAM